MSAALALLRGRDARVVARQLRGQDQAHVDALTKAIRGVGGETEAEAGELEPPGPEEPEEALAARLRRGERRARRGPGRGAPPADTRPRARSPRRWPPATPSTSSSCVRCSGAGLAASVPRPSSPATSPRDPWLRPARKGDDAGVTAPSLRDRPLLLASPLADDRGLDRRSPSASSSLGQAGESKTNDNLTLPGTGSTAGHRTARRQPARTGLRQQPAGLPGQGRCRADRAQVRQRDRQNRSSG